MFFHEGKWAKYPRGRENFANYGNIAIAEHASNLATTANIASPECCPVQMKMDCVPKVPQASSFPSVTIQWQKMLQQCMENLDYDKMAKYDKPSYHFTGIKEITDMVTDKTENLLIVDLHQKFTMVTGKAEAGVQSAIIDSIVEYQGFKTVDHPIEGFKACCDKIILTLIDFSKEVALFQSLAVSDQRILLYSNIPIFVNFYLGKYFLSDSGFDQLTLMLEHHMSQMTLEEIARLKVLTVDETGLIFDPDKLEEYKSQLKELSSLPSIPSYFHGLLAALILFDQPEQDKMLLERKRILAIQECLADLIYSEELRLEDLKQMMDSLRIMSKLTLSYLHPLADAMITKMEMQKDDRRMNCEVGMMIDCAEQDKEWINQELDCVAAAFRSITIPGLALEYFFEMASSKPVKIPPDIVKSNMMMNFGRMFQVLRLNRQFNSWSDDEKRDLWNANSWTGILLLISKFYSKNSVMGQLENLVGNVSQENGWMEDLEGIGDVSKLAFITVDKVNKHMNFMDNSVLKKFETLLYTVGNFVKDHEVFKMLLLAVLFDPHNGASISPKIQDRYLLHLNKRLRGECGWQLHEPYFLQGSKNDPFMSNFKFDNYLHIINLLRDCSKILLPSIFSYTDKAEENET